MKEHKEHHHLNRQLKPITSQLKGITYTKSTRNILKNYQMPVLHGSQRTVVFLRRLSLSSITQIEMYQFTQTNEVHK